MPWRIAAKEKPVGGVAGDGLKGSDQADSAGRLEAMAVCWIERGPVAAPEIGLRVFSGYGIQTSARTDFAADFKHARARTFA